jgi:hypothetical protein
MLVFSSSCCGRFGNFEGRTSAYISNGRSCLLQTKFVSTLWSTLWTLLPHENKPKVIIRGLFPISASTPSRSMNSERQQEQYIALPIRLGTLQSSKSPPFQDHISVLPRVVAVLTSRCVRIHCMRISLQIIMDPTRMCLDRDKRESAASSVTQRLNRYNN